MSDAGHRILAGLKDAIDGNFSRVTMEGHVWENVTGIKKAGNAGAWALGKEGKRGFVIRRVVWGRMLARAEKRKGEQIRRATIYINIC